MPFQALRYSVDDAVDQALDDALLGGREVAAFDARVELADAAEQRVDDGEDQGRVADDQAGAAQRPHRDDVEVGRHHDLAQEGAEYFCTLMPPIETSGLLRMKLNRPMRMLRAKRSLMISIVGMRPRTMRSWLARS